MNLNKMLINSIIWREKLIHAPLKAAQSTALCDHNKVASERAFAADENSQFCVDICLTYKTKIKKIQQRQSVESRIALFLIFLSHSLPQLHIHFFSLTHSLTQLSSVGDVNSLLQDAVIADRQHKC